MPRKIQTLVNKRHPEGLVYCPSQKGLPPRAVALSRLARGTTTFVLVLVLIYFLSPIYWVIISATRSDSGLAIDFGLWSTKHGRNSESRSLFDAIGLNYEKLTSQTHGNFWRWALNSLTYSTVSAAIGILISIMAGCALVRFVFPGRNTATGVIMTGLLIPAALLTVSLYIVFLHLEVSNTMTSAIVSYCVSPFRVFLGRVYSQTSVPIELIGTARINGTSEARIFFIVVLRVLAPVMVTILPFIFVTCWNNFLLPLMMLSDETLKLMTLGLYGMMSYFNPKRDAVMIGALLGVIPLITLLLGLQRY